MYIGNEAAGRGRKTASGTVDGLLLTASPEAERLAFGMADVSPHAPAVGVARLRGVPLLHCGDLVRTVRAVCKRTGYACCCCWSIGLLVLLLKCVGVCSEARATAIELIAPVALMRETGVVTSVKPQFG
jgi:hypothetical protein